VDDRFGHYGTSGAVVLGFDRNIMRIEFLFLTCPVLGRQVEHAMFHWLADIAEQRNSKFIHIAVVNGRDNKVLSQLLQKLRAETVRDDNAATRGEATKTQFALRVAELKDSVKRIAPNPTALATIITNMNRGEAAHAR
jgi:predicted enzyme involved in methoxymalonyl-ACP biosynthesis